MAVAMTVTVILVHMAVAVIVIVRMIIGVFMCILICMPMRVPSLRISTCFGFKRLSDCVDDQMHGMQHVCQNVIRFNLQMVWLELNLHMTITQVVSGADQIVRRTVCCAMRDAQHSLRCCNDTYQRTVFGDQHIAATNRGAAR